MTNDEAVKLALDTQAEIERRITVGMIPPRPDDAAQRSPWFDAHLGCQRCRYGVREPGIMHGALQVCAHCIGFRVPVPEKNFHLVNVGAFETADAAFDVLREKLAKIDTETKEAMREVLDRMIVEPPTHVDLDRFAGLDALTKSIERSDLDSPRATKSEHEVNEMIEALAPGESLNVVLVSPESETTVVITKPRKRQAREIE